MLPTMLVSDWLCWRMLMQLENGLDQGKDHAAHFHDQLNSWSGAAVHCQVNLAMNLFLGAVPTTSLFSWVASVSMDLRDVSERHHHFTHEDIMVQPLPPKHGHLQQNQVKRTSKAIWPIRLREYTADARMHGRLTGI